MDEWSDVDGLRVSLGYWRRVLGQAEGPTAPPVTMLRSELRALVDRLEALSVSAGVLSVEDVAAIHERATFRAAPPERLSKRPAPLSAVSTPPDR